MFASIQKEAVNKLLYDLISFFKCIAKSIKFLNYTLVSKKRLESRIIPYIYIYLHIVAKSIITIF